MDNSRGYWGSDVIGPEEFSIYMDDIKVVLICVYVADQVEEQLIHQMKYKGNTVVISTSVLKIYNDMSSFYNQNMDKIEQVYELLADEGSRNTIEAFLNVLRTGDIDLWKIVNGNSIYKLVDTEVLDFNKRGTYIDIGAFIGDTLERFLKVSRGDYSKIA